MKRSKYFEQLNNKPKTTKMGLMQSFQIKIIMVALKDVILFMQVTANYCKGLVFDNPNSSTARYMKELAGIEELPKEVYSFKVNKDVVKFVSENDGMIGVVGLNWLYQPSPDRIL
jgi:phosphate transport system substrate-binding protein